MTNRERVYGSIFGAALGDSFGSPFEELGAESVIRILAHQSSLLSGQVGSLMPHHRAGDVSDDTFMSLGVIRGIYEEPLHSVTEIREHFLNWKKGGNYVKSAPGVATHNALTIGRSVESEGNGACMKAHISAVLIDQVEKAIDHALLVAGITHKSEQTRITEAGVITTVCAVRYAMSEERPNLHGFKQYIGRFIKLYDQFPVSRFVDRVEELHTSRDLHQKQRLSGWIYNTVPYAIAIWLKSPQDFRECLRTAVVLGGDTDTTASVVGGIIGAHIGYCNLPNDLIEQLLPEVKIELLEALSNVFQRRKVEV